MNVLIIEDEKLAADRLENLIKEYDASIFVAGKTDSVKDTVAFLKETNNIDLLFMDIQLADGLSFEIFNELDIRIPIIFTTAYNEYALKAFKVNSLDYLLKPIGLKELTEGMNKYKRVHSHYQSVDKEYAMDVKSMILREEKKRFVVKAGTHIQSVPVEEIQCFYSKEKLSFLCTKNKKFPIDYSLDQIERLVSSRQFFRINRKYILNISAIKDITQYTNSRLKVTLKNVLQDEELIVSREKVSLFKTWLNA